MADPLLQWEINSQGHRFKYKPKYDKYGNRLYYRDGNNVIYASATDNLPLFQQIRTRNNRQLNSWYSHYVQTAVDGTKALFQALVKQLVPNKDIKWCGYCAYPGWTHHGIEVDGTFLCRDHANMARPCAGCGTRHFQNNMHQVRRRGYAAYFYYCQGCYLALNLITCPTCRYPVPRNEMINLGGDVGEVCVNCRDDYFRICDRCGQYYRRDYEHYHPCECQPFSQEFVLKTTLGDIQNDVPIEVTLPSGHIDDVGIADIKYQLRIAGLPDAIVDEIEPRWVVAKGGTYPKRLGSALYKQGWKATDGLLAAVGTTAQNHTAKETNFLIDITRRLNEPATYFANKDSCWWAGYAWSRCAFKHSGGFGLRIIDPERKNAVGRVWVMPLGDDLQPWLKDDPNAPAFTIFNNYGRASSFGFARLFSFLVGQSYHKIQFSAYSRVIEVNGNAGFLIARPEVLKNTKTYIQPDKFKVACGAKVAR